MDDILKTTFNNEAESYDITTNYLILDYNTVLSEVVKTIDFNESDSFNILDAGCGTGNLMRLLKDNYPNTSIYGLDFSADMLNITKKKVPDATLIKNDIFLSESLPLPSFDLIVVSYVFHNFHSIDEHIRALKQLESLLSVNGKIIIADFIDPKSNSKDKEKKLISLMKRHQLSDIEINEWLNVLRDEDTPLTTEKNMQLLKDAGFVDISVKEFKNSYSALFTANKQIDIIQVKAELLNYGVQPNEASKSLYYAQNPKNITKTGNNGIFLTVDGLDVLISINHQANTHSPYVFELHKDKYILTKYGKEIVVDIAPILLPDWAVHPIQSNKQLDDQFANYFVYEGHGFIHLAYKSCSFCPEEKCKFCSVNRREEFVDNSPQAICNAISEVIDDIPDDVHFCLGGGTYLPFEKNIEYFKSIVSFIRNKGKKNPIWIEMIPPSDEQIQELIDAGATSFGFNIEIWNNSNRKKICPGKSRLSKERYINACKYVVDKLGPDSVGSCLIVGLDSRENIVEAIDVLLDVGVQPCILLYKDYDTNLGGYELPPQYLRDFVFLSKYAAEKAKGKNMLFKKSEGCLKCNCCTIMHDLQFNNLT